MSRIRTVAALAAALLVMTGCAAAQGERESVGEHVVGYRQDVSGSEWVGEVDLPSALVLESESDIQEWVGTLQDADPALFDPLYQVDLTENFLIVGGYPRCTEHSSIVLAGDGGEMVFEVTAPESTTMCAWSPYTIDVWAVPLSHTDGTPPGFVPIVHDQNPQD